MEVLLGSPESREKRSPFSSLALSEQRVAEDVIEEIMH
jgi:hypothetical protein